MATTTAADRKNELIISSLISTTSVRAAAKVCGVSETQIYARLRDPAFKKQYDDARRELLKATAASIQNRLGEALEIIYNVASDTEAAPQVRANAAEAFIRNSLKISEQVDVLEEIDKLKKAVFPDEQ